MRGPSTVAATNLPEARDDCKRKMKFRDYKEGDKYKMLSDRSSACKFHSLKLALFIITSCTVLTLLYSPTEHSESLHQPISGSSFVDAGLIWQQTLSDPRYSTNLDVDWQQIGSLLQNLAARKQNLRIGLLNFNVSELGSWSRAVPNGEFLVVHLDYANTSITWNVLYPEWIDEEEESEVPACPSLPDPRVKKGPEFDVVAVKLPCRRSENWSRDVARLHLQLSAAKLAAAASVAGGGGSQVHVLFVTECFPIPNLFSCKNLVKREGNAWLYKPDIATLQEKLRLPIGSCELALPLKEEVRPETGSGAREAFATILHSAEVYVCGAIAAARSIRLAGSTRDLVILVDESISDHHRSGLQAAGWKVKTIQRIRNPKAEKNAYNEYNYSKFRLWQLTEYDKVIFIDADLLILRNIDFLFKMPEISATGNDGTIFNSGVMVVEPCNCTFHLLMEHINDITSYNGGDQGYLNEIFTWWHRIPRHMNFLKHFWEGDSEEAKAKKTRLFKAETPGLYVLHYLGLKPWLCFRDFDCNWNSVLYQSFASDEAHATWWRVHDSMPEPLQRFCLLPTVTKAGLEFNRRKAEKANFPDEHWKRNVTDPRQHVCFENYCNWEDVLAHWGQPTTSSSSQEKGTPAGAQSSK
ncbi:UDP-glucuronate:xylan alpha-glucuronosyltransferase 1-like [Canna indica]|uniref:Hexosyltransferase n=1 Tax=Canna indica TaxID=4628 RepID=A0AAQ3JS75_9LILI|nr:UDP-glucuronate:xylan alpha-glucuronosyltransferase 1-like [Canna indica]